MAKCTDFCLAGNSVHKADSWEMSGKVLTQNPNRLFFRVAASHENFGLDYLHASAFELYAYLCSHREDGRDAPYGANTAIRGRRNSAQRQTNRNCVSERPMVGSVLRRCLWLVENNVDFEGFQDSYDENLVSGS